MYFNPLHFESAVSHLHSIDWLQSVESVPEKQVISNYHSRKLQGMYLFADLYLDCSLTSVISFIK